MTWTAHPHETPVRVPVMPLINARSIRFALPIAMAHWLLLVLIQCENFVGYAPRASRGLSAGQFFLRLPLLQTENLLAATVVGLAAGLLAGRRVTRGVVVALWVALSSYLVFDQVYYKVFFDHFRFSSVEGMAGAHTALYFSSIVHELDPTFFLNSIVVVWGTAMLAWWWVPRGEPAASRRGSWLLAAGAATLFVLGIPSVFSFAYRNVQHHPLLVLAHESTRPSLIKELRHGGGTPREILGPIEPSPPEQDARLPKAERACTGESGPPNVVLIVVESVGSRQLLGDDGLPSAQVTPRLAKLARGGVVFDSVYSIFPGTVRTHVAMTTGGRFFTWGSVYELLDYVYGGATLPRSFAAAGYDTALFAGERLDGENMASFMRKAGYRTVYDFAEDRPHHTKETMITSWGAREEYTIGLIERWLDVHKIVAPGPFFLNYLTAATHHPYGVPEGYKGPFPGDDDFSRYRNSMHYTDAAVGKLLDRLTARGLLDNTIVAITGDHGQAFGDIHPENYTHRNRIFEENVKSFLIVSPPTPRRLAGPVVSRRVATTGDIMPTLLAGAGVDGADVPGRSLWDEWFTPQPVFFHKNIIPEQWGLRDGPWKFIGGIRDHVPELYDLAHDPTEQVNLAGQQTDRARRYDALCQRLFIYNDDQFIARLQGYRYPGGSPFSGTEVRDCGPKRLTTGTVVAGKFVERSTFAPNEVPIAFVRLVAYDRDTPLEFRWVSPSGAEMRTTTTMMPDYSSFRLAFAGPRPMEQGTWTVSLHDLAGGAEPLKTQFNVREHPVPVGKSDAKRSQD